MAELRNLVVHVSDEAASRPALELAASIAARRGARLTALLVAPSVSAAIGLSAEAASLAHQLEQAQRSELQSLGERLAAGSLQEHGIALEWRLADGDAVDALQDISRTADLLVTSQRDPARDGGLSLGQSARLLMGAACPVLTVPYIGWKAGDDPPGGSTSFDRVLVAWSETRESARALRDALPLLSPDSQVELVRFADTDRAEWPRAQASLDPVAIYLRQHGLRATTRVIGHAEPSLGERVRRGWIPDVAVAEGLLSRAADMHADLIVMGGYGHSRLRQLVLGGVTRSMLESMTVPVLMSH